MLSSRLLHWLPVLEAVGTRGEAPSEEAVGTAGQEREARWYSGLGSREMAEDSWWEEGPTVLTLVRIREPIFR